MYKNIRITLDTNLKSEIFIEIKKFLKEIFFGKKIFIIEMKYKDEFIMM